MPDASLDSSALSAKRTAGDRAPPRAATRSLSALIPFLRPYRWQIALAGLLLLLAAAATLVFPVALRQLIDTGLVPADRAAQTLALRGHFALLFAVAVALAAFSAGRFYMVSWLGERVTADMRNAIYAHVLRQPPAFFETTQTGEVLSRLTTDTTLVQTLVGSSLSMGLRNAVMGIGALGVLVWTNPRIMGMVAAVILLVILPTTAIGRRVRRLSRASQDRVADTSAIAAEILNATPVVQGFTAEGRESARFAAASESAFSTATRRSRARALLIAFVIVANAALLLWGLYQGTQSVLAGRISAGHLGQTVVYIAILASAVAVLGEVYGDWLRAAGAAERLMELLALDATPQAVVLGSNEPVASVPAASNAIEFEAVTFHYPSRPQVAALQDFSLAVRAGETVALVGASGAGKSTVFQLLQRFYEADAGVVRVGGRDVRAQPVEALRAGMATVPQDATVFSTSARDNIRYGRPDADEAAVQAAARAAHAHAFLTALPEGYDTFVGERGVRLSGGQRQRIAIARALLKDAPILLLDEATSALDAESERSVQAALDEALEAAHGRRTTLVIAHRLATVQRADRIVVLDKGHIVEQGTHDTLVAAGGVYARLAALQFMQ